MRIRPKPAVLVVLVVVLVVGASYAGFWVGTEVKGPRAFVVMALHQWNITVLEQYGKPESYKQSVEAYVTFLEDLTTDSLPSYLHSHLAMEATMAHARLAAISTQEGNLAAAQKHKELSEAACDDSGLRRCEFEDIHRILEHFKPKRERDNQGSR